VKDYRVKITIRNDRLLNAIENKGIPSVRQFCQLYKLNYNLVVQIISGKVKPLNDLGRPIRLVEQIIDILDIPLEDAFTERQLKGFAKTNYEISVAEKELKQLVNPVKNQEQRLIESDVKISIQNAFSKRLNAREEKILRMHYGFNGGREHTRKELSELFNVSISRISEIIIKAERKLKHPSVSNNIINTGFNEIYTSVDIDKKLIKKAERITNE